jgi:8-oxo-dGTP diphosphatase
MRFPWQRPVQAAGGVVLRRRNGGPVEVALIHRPAYDDWTLPKGKLNPGETHEEAALREVREETGLDCRLGEPAGQVHYRDRKGRPKVVRYWTMQPVGPSDGQFAPNAEVDQLRWIPLAEAGPALTYDHDRKILESVKG